MGGRRLEGSVALVTGGAGFIGSHLCDSLLAHGNRVVCLDSFLTGRKSNVSAALGNPAFTLIEGDIRDRDACRKAVKGARVVFHQAALGSVPRSIKDPATTHEINVTGFLNVLLAAREEGVGRFVYASSSSVYGDSTELPKVEERIGRPLSPYAATKRFGEIYADVFARLHGIACVGLRYFNVFGPRQDPSGPYAAVIPRFIEAISAGRAPEIFGDGLQSRDFTFVDDVVTANHLAATADLGGSVSEVLNAGAGGRTTLNDLAGHLISILAAGDPSLRALRPVHAPPREGDIRDSHASIEKARKLLGYRPAYDLKGGLKLTVERWKGGSGA